MSGSWWSGLWRQWGWGAEQERRQEREEVRQVGDAHEMLAARIHEQKVRRRDIQMKLTQAEQAGKDASKLGTLPLLKLPLNCPDTTPPRASRGVVSEGPFRD